MLEPVREIQELMQELTQVCDCYVSGGSLLRRDSKDVDIVVLGKKEDYGMAVKRVLGKKEDYGMAIKRVLAGLNSEPTDFVSSGESQGWKWDGLTKAKYKGTDIDILYTDMSSIMDVMHTYPLTIQQVAWRPHTGFMTTAAFTYESLEVSEYVELSDEGVKSVVTKYLGYYPDLDIGPRCGVVVRSLIAGARLPF